MYRFLGIEDSRGDGSVPLAILFLDSAIRRARFSRRTSTQAAPRGRTGDARLWLRR